MWKRNAIHIDDVVVQVVEPSLEKRIVDQLEFYFGDANLQFDRFLMKETAKDNGWVPIRVLLTFRKLAGICGDAATIALAVRNAPDSLVEVDAATNAKIRRKPDGPAVPDALASASAAAERSVCCEGFPTRATMDDLLSFAASLGDGVVTKVTPRKYLKAFRGAVYLTFVSRAEAERFVNHRSVRFNGAELERSWHDEYVAATSGGNRERKNTEFRTGRLLRADVVDDSVTVMGIKDFFAAAGCGVPFVWIDDGRKEAWIRLPSSRAPAADVLRKIAGTKNAKIANFAVPDERTEETVLNIMAKQCFSVP